MIADTILLGIAFVWLDAAIRRIGCLAMLGLSAITLPTMYMLAKLDPSTGGGGIRWTALPAFLAMLIALAVAERNCKRDWDALNGKD